MQRVLAKDDHSLQAVLFDRSDKPFGVCVEIGRPWRELDRLHANIAEDSEELGSEQRIAVVDQLLLHDEEAIDSVSQIARDPRHPQTVWTVANSADLHSARREFNKEQYDEPP